MLSLNLSLKIRYNVQINQKSNLSMIYLGVIINFYELKIPKGVLPIATIKSNLYK